MKHSTLFGLKPQNLKGVKALFFLVVYLSPMTLQAQSPLYQISVNTAKGEAVSLSSYRGKVLIIVNVASKCGLTPQYDALQKLYSSYKDQGLVILGFPANQFLSQEPGSNDEIQQFCRLNYGVEFPVFAKIAVKGSQQHPLYTYLTKTQPKAYSEGGSGSLMKWLMKLKSGNSSDISWNFEKFLISRGGKIVERFAPAIKPDDPYLVKLLQQELKKP